MSYLPKDFVAHRMAEIVIDALEVVDVEHEQASGTRIARLLDLIDIAQELPAIADAGQRIGEGQIHELVAKHNALAVYSGEECVQEYADHDRG
ncbi:Uncharacterised protein [Mycobacterium tuberculosis]|nr:Uncharacterised protein [Mycobacterium tuberculosis]